MKLKRQGCIGFLAAALVCLPLATLSQDDDPFARFSDPGVERGFIERIPERDVLTSIKQGKVLLHFTAYTLCSYCMSSNAPVDAIAEQLQGKLRVLRIRLSHGRR